MEKKTFAFKLAARSPKDTGKWTARDGVALAGCSEVVHMNYREGDNSTFC
ncbi:MAG TPA: hypothetical protein VK614_01290 [Allosphingosinicella sp.]|nr:hypothetical protein [Allosphingosinicella sp.]